MNRGAWWATVHGVIKSWTWLSTHTHSIWAISHSHSFPIPKSHKPQRFFPIWHTLVTALAFDLLLLKMLTALKQQSQIYLAPETCFVEDNFSTDRVGVGGWGWFWGDSSSFTVPLISIIITSAPPQIIRHLIPEVGDPALILSLFLM